MKARQYRLLERYAPIRGSVRLINRQAALRAARAALTDGRATARQKAMARDILARFAEERWA